MRQAVTCPDGISFILLQQILFSLKLNVVRKMLLVPVRHRRLAHQFIESVKTVLLAQVAETKRPWKVAVSVEELCVGAARPRSALTVLNKL